jgi:hypothetical protein
LTHSFITIFIKDIRIRICCWNSKIISHWFILQIRKWNLVFYISKCAYSLLSTYQLKGSIDSECWWKKDVYKEQNPSVWLHFEQYSVSKGIIQHIVTLDIAIGKIKKKKEVQMVVHILFQKWDYSKDDYCIKWYRHVVHNSAFSFPSRS